MPVRVGATLLNVADPEGAASPKGDRPVALTFNGSNLRF